MDWFRRIIITFNNWIQRRRRLACYLTDSVLPSSWATSAEEILSMPWTQLLLLCMFLFNSLLCICFLILQHCFCSNTCWPSGRLEKAQKSAIWSLQTNLIFEYETFLFALPGERYQQQDYIKQNLHEENPQKGSSRQSLSEARYLVGWVQDISTCGCRK